MGELINLRENLRVLTAQILTLIEKRKMIVKEIQSLKDDNSEYSNFNPEQEKNVFQSLKDQLKNLSLRELLIVSLMIEEHATTNASSYPAWSEGEHVDHIEGLICQINPILLAVVNKDLYYAISLNNKFKKLINHDK